MKKRLLIFFCVSASLCSAQFLDTIQHSFRGKKSLDAGFDSRNSFIDNKRVGVQCLKMGIDFGKKITIGAGYAWLNANTPVLHSYSFRDPELKKDTSVNRRLKLQYGCFYINYIYYKSRRWEFSVPLQVGVGKLSYSYPYRGITKKENVGYCFLYEPEVNVKFTLLRWLGVEGDVGYRLLLQKNHMIKNTFNSPLFAIGVFINWNELALMAFPKNEWVQNKFGPSQW
ncbi:MAG: hypothetical protein ACXVPN_07050 [Bacteroidia bacterium]